MSSSATTWSCQISLRYEYDDAGVKMSVTQHTFSPVLTDRGQVELWIRRAQVAILSLHRTLTDCQNLSEDQVKDIQKNFPKDGRSMLQFSKNFVCVDINDPDATDISFVDLPGQSNITLSYSAIIQTRSARSYRSSAEYGRRNSRPSRESHHLCHRG